MRVTGPIGPSTRPPSGAGRATGVPGFSLPGPAIATGAAPAHAPVAAAALLGLQDIGPTSAERRRRGVRRGRLLPDRLDELHLGLLDGAVPLTALQGLRAELAGATELDGDERLRGLLDAIDVRCAVELAKLEASGAGG